MGNTNKAMETVLNLVHIAKHLEKGAFLDHSQLWDNKLQDVSHTQKAILGRENRVNHI